MEKFCGFPSIGQYRQIVKTITERTKYVGKDENGNAIYDHSKILPTQRWVGTVKLHGSNSGVSIDKHGNMWAQSRENIITVEKDNAGFAFFVESNKELFKSLFDKLDFNGYDYITIFGEWCGGNIQKGVAINGLDKMFVIFDIKRSYETTEQGDNVYSNIEEIKTLRSTDNRIYNIYDFKTYEIDIDFNNPAEVQNKIIEMTIEVENECPVGREFGKIGIGEGIVFSHLNEDGSKFRFKSKGEKHSSSKVKTLASVDPEKINSVKEFVEYSVTENRLSQGVEKVFGIGGELDIKRMGEFLKWIVSDIMKEEQDTLKENKLEPKDVTSAISNKGRTWLLTEINKL